MKIFKVLGVLTGIFCLGISVNVRANACNGLDYTIVPDTEIVAVKPVVSDSSPHQDKYGLLFGRVGHAGYVSDKIEQTPNNCNSKIEEFLAQCPEHIKGQTVVNLLSSSNQVVADSPTKGADAVKAEAMNLVNQHGTIAKQCEAAALGALSACDAALTEEKSYHQADLNASSESKKKSDELKCTVTKTEKCDQPLAIKYHTQIGAFSSYAETHQNNISQLEKSIGAVKTYTECVGLIAANNMNKLTVAAGGAEIWKNEILDNYKPGSPTVTGTVKRVGGSAAEGAKGFGSKLWENKWWVAGGAAVGGLATWGIIEATDGGGGSKKSKNNKGDEPGEDEPGEEDPYAEDGKCLDGAESVNGNCSIRNANYCAKDVSDSACQNYVNSYCPASVSGSATNPDAPGRGTAFCGIMRSATECAASGDDSTPACRVMSTLASYAPCGVSAGKDGAKYGAIAGMMSSVCVTRYNSAAQAVASGCSGSGDSICLAEINPFINSNSGTDAPPVASAGGGDVGIATRGPSSVYQDINGPYQSIFNTNAYSNYCQNGQLADCGPNSNN